MTIKDTILERLIRLLKDFHIDTNNVDETNTLGAQPIGFVDVFIRSEFRLRLNEWFRDFLTAPFVNVGWDGTTSLKDLVKAITTNSTITTAAQYRTHITTLTGTALDNAAGAGAQRVPEAQRPAVRDAMNTTLKSALFRNISLADLARERATIIANITEKMVL